MRKTADDQEKKNRELLAGLIIVTVCLFASMVVIFLPDSNKAVWPVLIIFGVLVIGLWIAYIVKLIRNKKNAQVPEINQLQPEQEPDHKADNYNSDSVPVLPTASVADRVSVEYKAHQAVRTKSLEECIWILRKEIVKSITANPSRQFLLDKLLWGEAQKCFPEGPFSWDLAEFYIDLYSGELFAEASTYPNQFGDTRKKTYRLTPAEFHKKAIDCNMRDILRSFETEEDWKKLLEGDVKRALSIVNRKELEWGSLNKLTDLKPEEKRFPKLAFYRRNPHITDPFAYEREYIWKYQEELIHIPDLSPARIPDDGASMTERERHYNYTDFNTTVYIDNRDGHLIRAEFSVPAFNSTAASRSDSTISYDDMHELVKRYMKEPRVKFYVKDPASLLNLNENNWEDWMLTYKYI